MISRSDTRLDNTRAKRRYPALFQHYGLAVGGEPAAQSVEKLHRSLIADDRDWWFYTNALGSVLPAVTRNLMIARKAFQAYRFFILASDGYVWMPLSPILPVSDSFQYNAARAAALAGSGQGLDAPPPSQRAVIREQALKWLNESFANRKGFLEPDPNGDARTGAKAPPREVIVHAEMNHWLSDLDLAGVRDDPWLAKLPAAEREQWRKLWSDVRSIRDRTAPRKSAPLPVRK